jgi:hypothetical protein
MAACANMYDAMAVIPRPGHRLSCAPRAVAKLHKQG